MHSDAELERIRRECPDAYLVLADRQAEARRRLDRDREVRRKMPARAVRMLDRLDAAARFFHELHLRTIGTWAARERLARVSVAAAFAGDATSKLRDACWAVAVDSDGVYGVQDDRAAHDGFVDGDGI